MLSPKPAPQAADPEKERRRREYEYLRLKAKSVAAGQSAPQPAQPAPQAEAPSAMGSRAPLVGATGEFDLSKFEALPKVQQQATLTPNLIDAAWRQGVAQVNDNFAEQQRGAPPRRTNTAEINALADAAAYNFQGAPTQEFDETGTMVSQGDVNRMLPARFGAAAVNAAGPGTVNTILEAGDAMFGSGPQVDYFGNPLPFDEPKPIPRITFGDDNLRDTRTPPARMLPSVQMDEARGAVEGGTDLAGTFAGYMAGPGKVVEAGARGAVGLARGVPGAAKAAAAITPQGAGMLAKGARYGGRVAATLPRDIAHAAAFGAAVGEDGKRLQTAGQFAADPINWAAIPAASLIYRASIALKTMGGRVTPEAVQLEQAMRTLQAGNVPPDQLQAAARTIDEMAPPAPDAGPAPSQADPAASTGARSKSMFSAVNEYSVSTADNGVFGVNLNRTQDGGAVILHDKGTIPITPEFAKGKSDEELLAYYFEPVGFQGATKGPTTQGAAQAAPQAPPAAAGAAANPQATQRAQQLLDGVDAGGIPSNPILVNRIARDLGLDVADDAPMADTIERVRTELAQQGQPTVPQGPAGGARTATQAAPGAPPPPVVPPSVAQQPPAVPPGAAAAQAPPPGTLTPIPQEAVEAFNAMPRKTREAMLRLLQSTGMDAQANTVMSRMWRGLTGQFGNSQEAMAAIRSLNNASPDQQTMFALDLMQRYGGDVETALPAAGRGWATGGARKDQLFGGRDRAREIMDQNIRPMIDGQGPRITEIAEGNFGPGVVPAQEALDKEFSFLSGEYDKLLNPQRKRYGRLRNPGKLASIDEAYKEIQTYLKRPDVIDEMPDWVKLKVMQAASKDMRALNFTPKEMNIILQGEGKVLAPLFQASGPMQWSPALWKHLVDQYPTQAAHILQSAYRQAADSLMSNVSRSAADVTNAQYLMRLRGESGNGGLIDMLERAIPGKGGKIDGEGGYNWLRNNFGDASSAEEALSLLKQFKSSVNDEAKLGEIMTSLKKLPPRQLENAEQQITSIVRQELGRKVDSPKLSELGNPDRLPTPNLTALSSQNFLNALEDVFGPRGKELADGIRLARAQTDALTSIHPRYNSRTTLNDQDVANAPNRYEDPGGIEGNVFDKTFGALASSGLATGAAGALGIGGAASLTVPLLGLAAGKAAYNAYKAGKRLTNEERNQLIEYLFRVRKPGEAAPRPPGNRLGAGGFVAGRALRDAAVGAAVGGVASGGDPNAALAGAVGGAGIGAARGIGRLRSSQIKPPPAPRGPRRGPPPATGNSLNAPPAPRTLPGQTSPASPTVTGIVAGGIGGAMLDQEDPARGFAIGAAGGGAVAGLGNRLSKMGGSKPKTVKPPPGAGGKPQPVGAKAALDPDLPPPPKERFLVGSDGSRKSLGTAGEEKTVKFTAPSGKQFQIEFRRDGDAMGVDFREVGAKAGYKPTGTGSAGEANAVLSAVQDAIKADVSQFGRPRYTFVGETAQQSRIYQQMARTTEPPKGYRWEGPDSNGAVHLQRADLAPPSKGPGGKPPPVQARKPGDGPGGIASRALVGGVIGAGVGSIAEGQTGDTQAQMAEVAAQMAKLQKTIDGLQAVLDIYDTGTPEQIQAAVARGGKYTKPDGVIGRETSAQVAADRARIAVEMKAALAELDKGRARVKQLEEQAAFDKTRPGMALQAARQAAPWIGALGGALGGAKMRGGAVSKAAAEAVRREASVNALLTPGPIKTGRDAATRAAVKGQPANINEYWIRGGAGDKVPFEANAKGDWRMRPKGKVMPASKLFPDGKPGLRKNDLAWIATGLSEAGLSTLGVDAAHKELAAAQAAVENDKTEANYERLERAHDMLALAETMQRAGLGFAAGRLIGAYKTPYKSARPNVQNAEAEMARIAEYLQRLKK